MTKAEKSQIDKISKKLEEIDKKMHVNHVDFYYRFNGKTIRKIDSWRAMPGRTRESLNRIKQSGIDPDREPLLIDLVNYKDNPLEIKQSQPGDKSLSVVGLFREDYREELFKYGLTEGEIEKWLRELTTKRR